MTEDRVKDRENIMSESTKAAQAILSTMPKIESGIVIQSEDFETYHAVLLVGGKVVSKQTFNRRNIERLIAMYTEDAVNLADKLF